MLTLVIKKRLPQYCFWGSLLKKATVLKVKSMEQEVED